MTKREKIKNIITNYTRDILNNKCESLEHISEAVNEILEIYKPRKLSKEKINNGLKKQKLSLLKAQEKGLIDYLNRNIDKDIWQEETE